MQANVRHFWHLCGVSLCNFDCAYCVSGLPEAGGSRTRKAMWVNAEAESQLTRVTAWFRSLPFPFRLRLQTIGEPFVSDVFLQRTAAILENENAQYVELVTNGSLLTRRLPRLLEQIGDRSRLSLWVTFHHTEIALGPYIEQIRFARDLGVTVTANALLFPDNVDVLRKLKQSCEEHEISVNVDPGYAINGTYGGSSHVPIIEQLETSEYGDFIRNHDVFAANLAAIYSPSSMTCAAGSNYFFITMAGDVYPCFPLAESDSRCRIGSIEDDAILTKLGSGEPVMRACPLTRGGCQCKEDFLNTDLAQSGQSRERSLGGTLISAKLSKAARDALAGIADFPDDF